MSCHRIMVVGGKKQLLPINNREEYLQLRNSRAQQVFVEKARKGDKVCKQRLMQFNYSCLPNANGGLQNSKRVSKSVGMDVDHLEPEKVDEMISTILFKHEEIGLLMLERSARGQGLHLVFKRDTNLTQIENLQKVADIIGCEFDQGAKDITRVFYTTTASNFDLLFLSDELFDNEPVEAPENAAEVKQENAEKAPFEPAPEVAEGEYPDTFQGASYRAIVDNLEMLMGGAPAEGARNQFVFAMACNLRYVCNHDPRWVNSIMPNYGEEPAKAYQAIRNACSRPQNTTIPGIVVRAVDLAKQTDEAEAPIEATSPNGEGLPPRMPEKLPKLIELLVSKTPDIYKPAVAHAVFPALAAHLYGVTFPYIDEVDHEATLMNVLMAGTGAGKSCITGPVKAIMADIVERDKENREKEREWKQEMQTKGANKDKKKRPEGLVIQWVRPDMTNAAFVQRTHDAEGRFLYTMVNEIDQFDALKNGAGSNAQFQIMCLAFDPGNTYGTERVGAISVSEDVCIRFNWNACTTINKGKRYFSRVLTDGPISRINFCTIPERPIGSEIPIYGIYDKAFERKLQPYITRLSAASGRIVCEKALALANKLKQENADFAQACDSRVFENLSFRGNVIAYMKCMVLYIANGCKWEACFEDFIRWSEQYDLWCKMHFFGDAIANEESMGKVGGHRRGCRNFLMDLPEVFEKGDLIALRRKVGKSAAGADQQIWNWKNRKLISEEIKDGVVYFKKL